MIFKNIFNIFNRNKQIPSETAISTLRDGFPFVSSDIVNHVISVIPLKTYNDVRHPMSGGEIKYLIKKAKVSFPDRLYALEVDNDVFATLDNTEKIILHCIYSRSCDGYVREKHIKALFMCDFPDWAIPYIFKVCDEYVVEILQAVYDNLKDKNTDNFKSFCAENHASFCLSYQRMVSYWNEYHKNVRCKYKDYIGRKLFFECFGANHKTSRSQ